MEKIDIFYENIQNLNLKINRQLKHYKTYKRNEIYEPNFNYEDFDNEIIEGESVIDCLFENLMRINSIFKLYEQKFICLNKLRNISQYYLIQTYQIRNETMIGIEKLIQEKYEIMFQINTLINNMNKIVDIELMKEKQKLEKNISKLKKENQQFSNEVLKYIIHSKNEKYEVNCLEKRKLEQWTKLQCDEILLDSTNHTLNVANSSFKKIIENKKNLVFLIETYDNIKFGGFVSSKIDRIYQYPHYQSISDEKTFIFFFEDNNSIKFNLKKEKKDRSFYLFCDYEELFFSIGYYNIVVHKNKFKVDWYFDDKYFDYQSVDHSFFKQQNKYSCIPKRLSIIQMK